MGDSAGQQFIEAARRLVDLIFTDDMTYFDSLPPIVDQELGTPLTGLQIAVNEERSLQDMLRAAKLVEEVSREVLEELPVELARSIAEMCEYRAGVCSPRASGCA